MRDAGIYLRGKRYWLRLYVRGVGVKRIPLVPDGSTMATTNKDVARVLAKRIRTHAVAPESTDGLIEAWHNNLRMTATEHYAACCKASAVRMAEFLNIRDVAAVTPMNIEAWLSYLAKTKSPATVSWYLATASSFFEWCRKHKKIETNPCSEVTKPKMENIPPRFLSKDEAREVLRLAVKLGIFAEVATALFTGMRLGNLRIFQWRHIDWANRLILVERQKGNRPYQVPLSRKLAAVLKAHRKKSTGLYVFPGKRKAKREMDWWYEAMHPIAEKFSIFNEAAGVGRGWHLLRHTFASRLAQAGVSLRKISAWMGHSSITTTMRYAHLAPGHDEEIEKL